MRVSIYIPNCNTATSIIFEFGVLYMIAICGSVKSGINSSKLIFVPGGVGIVVPLYVIAVGACIACPVIFDKSV